MARILIIDDERIIRERLSSNLVLDGHEVFIAENGVTGLDVFDKEAAEIVLVDIKMPGMDGIEVLRSLKKKSKETEVIMITGHGGIETAIGALKEGALSYIQKPIEYDELLIDIQKALEKQEMQRKLDEYVHNMEVAHTQLREQQAQILQAAKLTAVGQLGAGVAHEMNQPLMAISTHIEILLMNEVISSDMQLKEKIQKLKDQFARLGTIVRRLSDYSKGRIGEYDDVQVNQSIQDAYYLFGQQLKDHNIEVEQDLQDELPEVWMDRYQIQDVVINFLINARDAIDEMYEEKPGGEISIIVRTLRSKKAVFVGITDNGSPITTDVEAELFVPFFSTKPVGKGAGLGLSICHTIIKDHRGLIAFATLENKTKVFYFVLPVNKNEDLLHNEEAIHKEIINSIGSSAECVD